jgi:hypothetical protein
MRAVGDVMAASAPRRARNVSLSFTQISAITGIPLEAERVFQDDTPVDHVTLERILRSISFIGPAMNPARFAAFRERIHALSESPVWSRRFTLRWGRRSVKTGT